MNQESIILYLICIFALFGMPRILSLASAIKDILSGLLLLVFPPRYIKITTKSFGVTSVLTVDAAWNDNEIVDCVIDKLASAEKVIEFKYLWMTPKQKSEL